MKEKIIDLFINELQQNKIFSNVLITALDIYPEIKKDSNKEIRYYELINILDNYCAYLEINYFVFDISKLIKKRFNDILSLDNIIKCLEIIKNTEV